MNLATMRTQFKAHTSGLADQMADADIDVYLNRMFQFVIPTEVDGSLSEYVWGYALLQNTSQVLIPSMIVSLNQAKAFIHETGSIVPIRLFISYDYLSFITRWPDWSDDNVQGRPDEILIYEDYVTFNRNADVTYYGGIQCRGVPTSGIRVEGLADEIHALAVAHGSAWMYLQEKEDSVGAAREGGLYDIYKNLLLTRSQSRYQPRRPARSY